MIKSIFNKKESKPPSFRDSVAKKLIAIRKKEKESKAEIWFGIGMFGIIGWLIAIPSIIGLFIGIWLDQYSESKIFWTINFFLIGLIMGILNAWFWVRDILRRIQSESEIRKSKND